jgi:hypothetical protein
MFCTLNSSSIIPESHVFLFVPLQIIFYCVYNVMFLGMSVRCLHTKFRVSRSNFLLVTVMEMIYKEGLRCVRRLVVGLALRRLTFNPRLVHVGFLANKVVLGQVFL